MAQRPTLLRRPPRRFRVTATRDHTRLTVTLHGEFDLSACEQFAAATTGQLAARPAVVVLDLAGLTFMGAAGINALLDVKDAATRCSAAFALTNLPPAARRVLAICELTENLEPQHRGWVTPVGSRP